MPLWLGVIGVIVMYVFFVAIANVSPAQVIGVTIVIGGLTVTTVTKTRSGIPLLSGLPIVGKLFSFNSESENRRDLIILVTPRIVDDGISTP